MIAIQDMVYREVLYCVSGLVQDLLTVYASASMEVQRKTGTSYDELLDLIGKANPENQDEFIECYEHWIVSEWLAGKLETKGEIVIRDICGLTIWGRTTTGQAISMDHVIQQIYNELFNPPKETPCPSTSI